MMSEVVPSTDTESSAARTLLLVVSISPRGRDAGAGVVAATEVADLKPGLVAAPVVPAADGADVAVGVVAVDGVEAKAPDFVALVPYVVAAAAAPGSPVVLATT